MSFILDALRKSEHQRQRTTGPGLAEVPVARARTKSNVWATAAVALLVVNLVAVGVLLLRRAGQEAPAPAAATAAPADEAPATVAAPLTTPANPTLDAPPRVAPPSTPLPTSLPTSPPASTPPRPAVRNEPGRNPLAAEVGQAVPGVEPTLAAGAASVPAGPAVVSRQAAAPKRGTVTYATVPEASDPPYTPPVQAAAPPAARAPAGLPSADEMVARGVPELHLDLHVYANVPQQRFIFVNSRKYREGDTLQEGPVVEQITQDGAVLSFRGSRFRLSHD
jgi:general secretion pathway protein B